MRIGVIALQGDISEHIQAFKRVLDHDGEVIPVRHKGVVPRCDALVLPGGESTTLGRLLTRKGIADEIVDAAENGTPIMGTCAGMVLLANQGDEQVKRTGQNLLGLMEATVNRNAFGRQRESFETPLHIKGMDKPYPGVFIRAPAITKHTTRVEVLARYQGLTVAARQQNILSLAFHPELTRDPRLHRYFLEEIR